MGLISTDAATVADADKLVISLWFRVPQTSIDAAAANVFAANLGSTVPLLTFGRPQYQPDYAPFDNTGVIPGYPSGVDVRPSLVAAGRFLLDPSYIGLYCFQPGGGGANVATLSFNLQSDVTSSITGLGYEVTSATVVPGPGTEYLTPGSGYIADPGAGQLFTTEADHSLIYQYPVFYNVRTNVRVAAGVWHHVLLSVDLSNGCRMIGVGTDFTLPVAGVSKFSKAWLAVDDVNITGDTLGTGTGGGDPNMILPDLAVDITRQDAYIDGFNHAIPAATYAVAATPLPLSGGPLGLPASSAFASSVRMVELAELQIYAGVSLDTSDVNNRRLFITETGKPVAAKMGDFGAQKDYSRALINDALDAAKQTGVPLDLVATAADVSARVNVFGTSHPEAGPSKALGQPPDVLLHGARHWIMGQSTGSADRLGLSPTGTIKAFKPDPKVGD